MAREVPLQYIEELHQPGGDKLRIRQIGRKRHLRAQVPQRRVRRIGFRILAARSRMSNPEISRHKRIQLGRVELVEIAVAVDEDVALEGLFGGDIIADAVVGEVVEDFHGEEEARGRYVLIPSEDGAVDDVDFVGVAAGFGGGQQMVLLHCSQRRGDLDDVVLGAVVDLGVNFADVVQDIEHQRSSTGAHLVDEEIMIWVCSQTVVVDEVASDRFAVIRAEEFGRGVPELTSRVFLAFFLVKLVFEGGVAAAELGLELDLVADGAEVEGLAGRKDDCLFRKIAIRGIVETV